MRAHHDLKNDGEGESKETMSYNEKMENEELKILLSQTSEMNAVISAGQFNLHKKDV